MNVASITSPPARKDCPMTSEVDALIERLRKADRSLRPTSFDMFAPLFAEAADLIAAQREALERIAGILSSETYEGSYSGESCIASIHLDSALDLARKALGREG